MVIRSIKQATCYLSASVEGGEIPLQHSHHAVLGVRQVGYPAKHNSG